MICWRLISESAVRSARKERDSELGFAVVADGFLPYGEIFEAVVFHEDFKYQISDFKGSDLKRPQAEWNSTTSHWPDRPRLADITGMPRVMRTVPRVSPVPSCAFSCITRPSAVNLFSDHACSRWINAHWRGQYSQCWSAEMGMASGMVLLCLAERVDDFQSFDDLAVVYVFGIENLAMAFKCGCDDE